MLGNGSMPGQRLSPESTGYWVPALPAHWLWHPQSIGEPQAKGGWEGFAKGKLCVPL